MRNDQPTFYKGFRRPNSDFKAVQSQLQTEVLCYEVDLSVARSFTNLATPFAELTINGNSFYVDQNTDVGNATVIFEDRVTTANPIGVFAQPGSIFYVPFTRVKIANAAQAGKKLRIFYGVDIQFVPALTIAGTTNVNVTNAALAVNELGFSYQTSFASTTASGAITPQNIIAAVSNVNGYRLWDASNSNQNPSHNYSTFLAKATAPASMIDGDLLCMTRAASDAAGNFPCNAFLLRAVNVGAGKRLDFMNLTVETLPLKSALYTLL